VAFLARALKWQPDHSIAAARLYDALARREEARSLPRAVLRHEGDVESAQFSPDGTRIVTASRDKTARVWDAVTGKVLGEPMRH
jgi:WD40 repeat protein